jgi:hypothetical protein
MRARVGPDLRWAGRTFPIFRLTALTGTVVAVTLAVWESSRLGASPVVELGVCFAAILTFLTLVFVTKAIAGGETLVYYHHEIAVLTVTAMACVVLGRTPGPYLDATALGLGACLAFGRVGCLAAGCCHGRPAARGIVYGGAHATAGLPPWLLGARLVPVQAIESALVVALVAVGLAVVADPYVPGAAFAWYVESYAVVRFFIEELRGDSSRRFARGLSEAQWTSLAVSACMALLGLGGVTPGGAGSLVALALIGPAAVVLSRRARGRDREVHDPRHVRELERLVRRRGPVLSPGETSLGVLVSGGRVELGEHWSMSRRGRELAEREATVLAQQLAAVRRPGGPPPQIVRGVAGVFHVLLER